MGAFSLKIAQWTQAQEGLLDRYIANIVLELRNRLVIRSPVDTGRFRSNWFISEGSPSGATSDATTPDLGQGADALTKAAGKVFYITNNIPYGPVIEYGGYPNPPKRGTGKTIHGFSTQAPLGVVALTLLEFNSIREGVAQSLEGISVTGIAA